VVYATGFQSSVVSKEILICIVHDCRGPFFTNWKSFEDYNLGKLRRQSLRLPFLYIPEISPSTEYLNLLSLNRVVYC
jgi:hypothetical protein